MTTKIENLKGAVDRPDAAKARVLDDEEIERMLAEREETEKAEKAKAEGDET